MFDWDCYFGVYMGGGYSHWGEGGIVIELYLYLYLYLCFVIIPKVLLRTNVSVCVMRRASDIYTPILSRYLVMRHKLHDFAVLLTNCWPDYLWVFWMIPSRMLRLVHSIYTLYKLRVGDYFLSPGKTLIRHGR